MFFNQNNNEKLLIIILSPDIDAGLPILEVPSLHLKFAHRHAIKHNRTNCSAVICSVDGAMTQLDDYCKAFQTRTDIISTNKKEVSLLNSAISKLPKARKQFDRILIIGDMDDFSQQAADRLFDFNNRYLKEGGMVRVQICRFVWRKITDTEHTFAEAICPNDASLSIPEDFSIISPKSERALDIRLNFEDFKRLKVPLSTLLNKRSLSNQTLAKTIEDFLNKCNVTGVCNFYLVNQDGTRESFDYHQQMSQPLPQEDVLLVP